MLPPTDSESEDSLLRLLELLGVESLELSEEFLGHKSSGGMADRLPPLQSRVPAMHSHSAIGTGLNHLKTPESLAAADLINFQFLTGQKNP